MKQLLIPAATVLMLAACQPADETAPADDASTAPPPVEEVEQPETSTPAFVGAWTADASWCGNTVGPERPVVITETEFRGYENTCQITDLQPADGQWTATFVCEAEGQTTREPVSMTADEGRLSLTWVEQGQTIEWSRCPA